jgi:pantoate--beta-alanine ligase
VIFLLYVVNNGLFCTVFEEQLKCYKPIQMKVIHTIKDLQAELSVLKIQGKKVGLVPTMGALHAGHASLVKRSVAENDVTVISVFVNPTQFNDKNDLIKYPRTLDADCELLEANGASFTFAPSVEEMYPQQDGRQFSFAPLDTVMEGAFRPGHFNGVCQIVSKLFDAVQPDRAYFGEKDFQQLAIIREMVKQLHYPLQIVGCPIIREEDGLALSSRNARLSVLEREKALKISQTLFKSRTFAATHSVSETQQFVEDAISAEPGLRLEYFEIVDGNTLQRVNSWEETSYVVGCITVFSGEIRLIDNVKYKEV